jgi:hypothetical protein
MAEVHIGMAVVLLNEYTFVYSMFSGRIDMWYVEGQYMAFLMPF